MFYKRSILEWNSIPFEKVVGSLSEAREGSSAVTLETIANVAKVHVSTVSRAINGDQGGINSNTGQRIREIARQLGYRKNQGAATLRTGTSQLVGVLVPKLSDIVLATLYEEIDAAAGAAGYSTVVANTFDQPELRGLRVNDLLARGVDGLIFCDGHLGDSLTDYVGSAEKPCVAAVRAVDDGVSICGDDRYGGGLAAGHLINLGHREVGVIAGDLTASTGRDRSGGFADAYAAAGVPVPGDRIIASGYGAEAGYTASMELLHRTPHLTAIFVADDLTAMGAMGAIRDSGYCVGDDISLVGYNDIKVASMLTIPLTTVRSPLPEIARSSVTQLLSLIQQGTATSITHAPSLIVRESTTRLGEN